jgi:putative transposase
VKPSAGHRASRRESGTDIFKYIELFYNRKRKHAALDHLSPVAFEERHYQITVTQVA